MITVKERIEQISNLVVMLSTDEQNALFKALKKQILLTQANRLNQSVKPNSINMQSIIEEIQKVRQTHYDASYSRVYRLSFITYDID